jgi:hypothetical protein
VPGQKIDLNIITYHNDISLGAKVMSRLRLGFTLAPRLAPWLRFRTNTSSLLPVTPVILQVL